MDAWMVDAWMDGWMDGWMNRHMGREEMNGWVDG